MPRIAIVDYKLEDLALVETALQEAGADAFPSSDAETIAKADGIVLAGSTAFAEAIEAIRDLDLEQHLKAAIVAKRPTLCINVGMHLIFSVGCEISLGQKGDHVVNGLRIRPGACTILPDVDSYGFDFELPHQGFAEIYKDDHCCTPLLDSTPDGEAFFFSHSFIAPVGPAVQAWTKYSTTFPAVVDVGQTCFGVQFLPEKSGDAGLRLLERFVQICDEAPKSDAPLKLAQGPLL